MGFKKKEDPDEKSKIDHKYPGKQYLNETNLGYSEC